METENPIRILFVEDVPFDAEIAARELKKGGIKFTSARVDTKEAFLKELDEFQPDIIISDYSMPEFDGMLALKLVKEHSADIPFIMLTGSINEETAVECMKAGATDYVLKDRIVRLPFAVQEAFERMKDKKEKKAARHALRESEERFRTLVESAPEAIYVQSKGYFVYLNPAMLLLLGASKIEKLLGTEFMERIAPEFHEVIRERISRQLETGKPSPPMEQEYIRLDGSRVSVETTAMAVRFQDSDAHLVFVRDITGRKTAEKEMRKLITAVDHAADWILITDHKGIIEYVNQAVENISGYSREELIGKTPSIFKSGRHDREFYNDLWKTIRAGNNFSAIFVNRKKSGELYELHYTMTPLKDEKGSITHFVCSAKDITLQKLLEERIEYTAYYDNLTGLPNKKLFGDRLSQSLPSADQQGMQVAVLLMDIDRFTSLNETYGYETGDEILKETGRRLSQEICSNCTVSRVDADKFGILFADIQNTEDVILALEKIQNAFKNPLKIADKEIQNCPEHFNIVVDNLL